MRALTTRHCTVPMCSEMNPALSTLPRMALQPHIATPGWPPKNSLPCLRWSPIQPFLIKTRALLFPHPHGNRGGDLLGRKVTLIHIPLTHSSLARRPPGRIPRLRRPPEREIYPPKTTPQTPGKSRLSGGGVYSQIIRGRTRPPQHTGTRRNPWKAGARSAFS